MIKKVGKGFKEGDIIEFNEVSEPLYLYVHGELIKINPREYNKMIMVCPGDRFFELGRMRDVYDLENLL